MRLRCVTGIFIRLIWKEEIEENPRYVPRVPEEASCGPRWAFRYAYVTFEEKKEKGRFPVKEFCHASVCCSQKVRNVLDVSIFEKGYYFVEEN